MKYYKDSDNQTYMYKADGSEDHTIPSDQTEITEAEANAIIEQELASRPYGERRKAAYKTIEEQLDMQYWDRVNGTDTWKQHIDAVKTAHPKPTE